MADPKNGKDRRKINQSFRPEQIGPKTGTIWTNQKHRHSYDGAKRWGIPAGGRSFPLLVSISQTAKESTWTHAHSSSMAAKRADHWGGMVWDAGG